jgi:phosphoribosylanthranilate isomerase
MSTRIKICGITRIEDAECASREGADAIGLVFAPESPRCISVEQARAIAAATPPFVTRVGLFVNAAKDDVQAVLGAVPIDLLQFHGEEEPAYCGTFGRPYIKAIRMRPELDVLAEAARYADAAGFLLDAFDTTARGGTGVSFNWTRIPADIGKPLILAGGLTPDNVAEAVRSVRPYAVDVSSGVEASPGRSPAIKDHAKIRAFIQAVRNVS